MLCVGARTLQGVLFLVIGGVSAVTLAQTQTEAQGRIIFRDAGCTTCHAYVSNVGAPSAKRMRQTFAGNPQGYLGAIGSAPSHASDPTVKLVSKEKIRQISEWGTGAWAEGAALSAPAAPVAVIPKPAIAVPESLKAKADKAADAAQIQKKESESKARLAAQEREQRAAAEQLKLKRDADDKARKAGEQKAARDAELQAIQKRESEELAKRVAEAKLRNDVEAQTRLKKEADEKAKRLETERQAREAEDRIARQKAADELVQREMALKARRDADEQLALKKEVEDRARQQADAAKRDAEAKARKDAEAVAAAKPATASTGVANKGERETRPPLKAPEKFRDEPCPPSTGAPVTNVDEARAKAIMDRIDCSGCHAYVQKKTGPSFKSVFEKVKGNPGCVIMKLKKNKEHNEEGVTDELKPAEFQIIADYLATRAK